MTDARMALDDDGTESHFVGNLTVANDPTGFTAVENSERVSTTSEEPVEGATQDDLGANSGASVGSAVGSPAAALTEAKRSFYESAINGCLAHATSWVRSHSARRAAKYRLLEEVAKVRVDGSFVLAEFCLAIGYSCSNPEHKNPSLVILKALTWKAGEEMADKTASKYGLVVEWLVERCPDPAAIVQFLANHGGIQGADEMRSQTLPPSDDDGRRRSGSGAGERSVTRPEKLFGVTPGLPDGTKIIAVREGGKWRYESTSTDVPTEVEA
ncbi:hypothetical protein [Acidocella facilis]|uniref:hypothetical protein n=1 Tax=Acidocella facilis TaxID=525 RepID=UPI001F3C6F9E|nr:hypothetical protein [Acidocella facilis]